MMNATIMIIRRGILLWILLLSSQGHAVESCMPDSSAVETERFSELLQASVALGQAICDEAGPDAVNDAIVIWRNALQPHIDRIQDDADIDSNPLFDAWESEISNGELSRINCSTIGSPGSPDRGVECKTLEQRPLRFSREQDKACSNIDAYGKDCRLLIAEIADIARVSVSGEIEEVFKRQRTLLKGYSARWDAFFSVAREQNILEHLANSRLHREEISSENFVEPPDYQLTILHPNLAIEYVPDAPSGDSVIKGVNLEIIGINWWDQSFPIGVSYSRMLSSHSGVDSNRKAITLVFDNTYTIAVSEVGDETSLIFSLDLLELYAGKRQKYDAYLDYISNVRQ